MKLINCGLTMRSDQQYMSIIDTITKQGSVALNILLTKTTAAQNEDALSYYIVRGCIFWQLFL